jgi:MoxR-like ATPase
MQYAVKLVAPRASRRKYGLAELAKYITYGASPRATIGMIEGARALALLRGRRYVLPEDITDLVPDVLRHRVVLSYEALAEGLTADALIQRVMKAMPRARQAAGPRQSQ